MVVLDGHITKQGINGDNSAVTIDLDNYDQPYVWEFAIKESLLSSAGQRTVNRSTTFARSLLGSIDHIYKEDYYHRIHVVPETLALGNVLSNLVRYVYVWNAFYDPKTLDDVTEEGTEGIFVTEPVATPVDYLPLEEKTYTVEITTAGPPNIDAAVNFQFAVYTLSVDITGSRIVLWTWIPREGYTEELQWKTNILKTRQGEQRVAYREAPRQIFNYDFLRPPREAAQVKTAADNWSYRRWGLPIWKEMTTGIDAVEGDASINFDTSYRDYREDGLAVIWESADKAEAMTIINVRTDGIDLNQGLQGSYTNALVMPLRKAITPDGFSFARSRGKWINFSATFLVIDNIDLSAASNYEQYGGYDVLTDGNIIVGDMSERINQPVTQIDNGQGPITIETNQDYAEFRQIVGKIENTVEGLWLWRQWLHSRYGKQKPFYLPSWNNDIQPVEIIDSSKTVFDISPVGFTIHGDFPIDTRLVLNSEKVYYRQVTAAEKLDNGNERITIDTTFGQDIALADIFIWSFIYLVRFDSDSVEIEHNNPYIARTSIPVRRVPA